ncbi:MAG: glycerol-3-phosphate 1-O-acyltransferase PlsY [Hyphomonadaceae bacterium]|nr:glycerol-3-phosphate 1-O-acyltransferase PlsY [Hyphomonadaceae bacterium]MBC6411702.1 glycerol-3-phosphate 1-O-acyltransferase PlsY [Hyphomonadaceae bacterium]
MIPVTIALVAGYVLGSVPFGLILTRLAGPGDIRNIGSGNIGATNVLRAGSKPLAALTLLLDAGKAGTVAFLVNHFAGSPYGLFAGAAALIGHCFPVWLGFRGGKGVATFFGCLLAMAWPVGLLTAAIWIGVAAAFGMSSFAALCSALAAPVFAFFLGRTDISIMAAVLAVVIFVRHKQNISLILSGTESRIGQKTHRQS